MKYFADFVPYGHVKCLWTDNGTGFTSDPFVLSRVKHNQSAPYSPHENRTAELSWWTLFSLARCLKSSQNCIKTWGFTHWWLQHILEIIVIMKTQEKQMFYRFKTKLKLDAYFCTICFCYVLKSPTTIHCDNQSSIILAKHPVVHQRSKHIDIKFQFIHY